MLLDKSHGTWTSITYLQCCRCETSDFYSIFINFYFEWCCFHDSLSTWNCNTFVPREQFQKLLEREMYTKRGEEALNWVNKGLGKSGIQHGFEYLTSSQRGCQSFVQPTISVLHWEWLQTKRGRYLRVLDWKTWLAILFAEFRALFKLRGDELFFPRFG